MTTDQLRILAIIAISVGLTGFAACAVAAVFLREKRKERVARLRTPDTLYHVSVSLRQTPNRGSLDNVPVFIRAKDAAEAKVNALSVLTDDERVRVYAVIAAPARVAE